MAKKTIEYRGVIYTRYDGRLYYNPNGTILSQGGTSLHRQMWLDAGREIPDGWHVHHTDNDHDHNALDNFECLPPGEHWRLHIRERMGEIQAKLAEWRATDGGKQTLRDNARKMHARTPRRSLTCACCGRAFKTRHPSKIYCSPKCSLEVHARQIWKNCEICGAEFWTKRHKTKEVRTCSYRCGWALRRKNQRL